MEIGHHESKGETSKCEVTKGDAKPPEKAEQRQRCVATPEVIKNKNSCPGSRKEAFYFPRTLGCLC